MRLGVRSNIFEQLIVLISGSVIALFCNIHVDEHLGVFVLVRGHICASESPISLQIVKFVVKKN